jgi:hypothetical protein
MGIWENGQRVKWIEYKNSEKSKSDKIYSLKSGKEDDSKDVSKDAI